MNIPKWAWYAVIAFGIYWVFLRRFVHATGGAVASGSLAVGTGAAATPWSGYPPGTAPPGYTAAPGSSLGAPQPSPIIYQQAAAGNSTGGILTGVGDLLGGIGKATGSVLSGLGSSGLLGSSSSSGGSTYASDDNWGGDW